MFAASALPAVSVGLRQADVRQDPAGEFVRQLVNRGRQKVVGGNERENGRSSVGGAVHVADMDFVERSFAHAENQRPLFFETNIGGALDQVRSNSVGNAGQRAHTARQNQ